MDRNGCTYHGNICKPLLTGCLALPARALAVGLEPIQDLHGYDHPWAAGAGKNKLPMTVDRIKAVNTTGTWDGNVYTLNDVTITILTDADNNVIGITFNGTASAQITFPISNFVFENDVSYILNGAPSGSAFATYFLSATLGADYGSGTTITGDGNSNNVRIIVQSGVAIDTTFYPMIRLSTELDATFAPYTNICPISGRTGTSVSTRNEDNTETASATISFGTTVYGGQVDFKTGNVTVEWGYIASYNGETLPGAWISDRDVYASGTTPTTGAQVAYELATPTTLSLTPDILTMLKNNNSVSGDGVITITALTGDSWS